MTKIDDLHDDIIEILSDKKFHPISELSRKRKNQTLEVKELLLEWLRDGYVICKGTRWKLLKKIDKSFKADEVSESGGIYIVCPNCKIQLPIQQEFIGMRCRCTQCNTEFYISRDQISTNEYGTILIEQVENE